MAMKSSPNLNVKLVTRHREEGISAMKREQVVSMIGIPSNFERDILSGVPSAMTLVANGAFIVMSRPSMAGASGILTQVATEAIAKELLRYGIPQSEIDSAASRSPSLVVQPM